MERCWPFVPVRIVRVILDQARGATYSGNMDGCKFIPENLALLKILGGIRSPNETATTKLIFEGALLRYSGGYRCQWSAELPSITTHLPTSEGLDLVNRQT